MKKALFSLFLIFTSFSAFSSHVLGGFVDVECIGNGQYIVTLGLYEDCGTAFISNNPQVVTANNACGLPLQSFSLPNNVYQQPMNIYCAGATGYCGSQADILYHEWMDTISLDTCSSWELYHNSCCYGTTANLSGQPGYHYSNTFDNTSECISSVSAQNLTYSNACVNQSYCYNPQFTATEFDSVVYSLDAAETSSGADAPYNTGYSGSNPIPGISIDPNTGEICVTPTTIGNFVVNIFSHEYSNGQLVVSSSHTITLYVINCAGSNTPPTFDGLSNLSNPATISGSQISICAGNSVCFDLTFSDIDVSDNLSFSSNLMQQYPTASLTTSGTNPLIASVCIPNISNNSNLFFEVTDSACPLVGEANASYSIEINGSSLSLQDQSFCAGSTVSLSTANNATWTVLNGDPSLGCNNCTNQNLSPNQVSTYAVEMDNGCGLTLYDTLTLTPVTNNVSLPDTIMGNCGSYQIIAGTNDVQWIYSIGSQIGDTLSSDSLNVGWNMIVAQSGTAGCQSVDTVHAYVDYGGVNIWASDSSICDSGFVNLEAILNNGVCSSQSVQVGTAVGANTSNSFPAPYGNWYRNAKLQFLFLANELQAQGLTAGYISSISWDVTQINGTTTYNSFEIQMGHTVTNSLSNWEFGLVSAQDAHTRNILLGLNTHVLDYPFYWDGVSNVVVQICYDNLATNYTNNSITPWDQTTFNSTLYYRSDATAACPYLGSPVVSTYRPLTTFQMECDTSLTPTLTWSPSNSILSPNSYETATQPGYTGWIYANVINPISGCTAIDSVEIFANDYSLNLVLSDTILCDTGNIIAQVSGNHPSNSVMDWTAQGQSYQDSSNNYNYLATQSSWVHVETGNNWCYGEDSAYVWVSDLSANAGSIFGNSNVIENSTETYFYSPSGNYTYNWLVTGGSIVSGQGSNTVDVMWSAGPNGGIAVWITDSLGCSLDDSLAVLINPLAVQENLLGKIEVYPNPSSGMITFNGLQGISSLNIFSVEGRKVISLATNSQDNITIDASYLSTGLYQILDENGILRARLVIQH